MKKTNFVFNITKVLSVLIVSIFTLTACAQPTGTPSNSGRPPANPTNTGSTETPDSPTSPETPTTPTTPTTPSTQQRILIILPQDGNNSFAKETWVDINFVSGSNLNDWQNAFVSSSDCEIEIMQNGNDNNITLEATVYSSKVSVRADREGLIYFRVKNNRANIVSNYIGVTFSNNSSSGSNVEVRFVGTWQTSFSQGLIDTVEFYSNVTGGYSNSRYPSSGSDTFRWSGRDATTLESINSLNSTSTCSYSFAGVSLVLTNFLGLPQNTAITFIKQ